MNIFVASFIYIGGQLLFDYLCPPLYINFASFLKPSLTSDIPKQTKLLYTTIPYFLLMPRRKIDKGKLIVFPPDFRVKYKDVFDVKDFYEFFHEWLLERGWGDSEEDDDHWEPYYFERVQSGNVKEIELHWRVAKDAPNSPFKYYLDLNWHIIGLSSVDVVKDGIKRSVNKGEIEVEVKGFIEELYKDYFDAFSLTKQFKKLFSKRVYDQTIEFRKKEIYQETYALQNAIKQWFKLKRYLPYEETKAFFPSRAWPSHMKE